MAPATTTRPPLWARFTAAAALTAAVLLVRLPLRWQLSAARSVALLPAAPHRRAAVLHQAVVHMRPHWWPGRIACLEVSLATVIACALTGRCVHLVLGARFLPNAAHAWIRTTDGELGLGEDAADRPWTPALIVPTRH